MDLPRKTATTKQAGDAAEDRALAHLVAAGLRLVARNYRTPGRGGGEIDLVMRDPDGTLVFVEVRRRASQRRRRQAAADRVRGAPLPGPAAAAAALPLRRRRAGGRAHRVAAGR